MRRRRSARRRRERETAVSQVDGNGLRWAKRLSGLSGASWCPVVYLLLRSDPLVCSYEAVLPVYHLWLGYMAELLALPVIVPPAVISPPASSSTDSSATPREPLSTPAVPIVTSTLLPTYPPRASRDTQINVVNLQTKLIKAEFVGCLLSGASASHLIEAFANFSLDSQARQEPVARRNQGHRLARDARDVQGGHAKVADQRCVCRSFARTAELTRLPQQSFRSKAPSSPLSFPSRRKLPRHTLASSVSTCMATRSRMARRTGSVRSGRLGQVRVV